MFSIGPRGRCSRLTPFAYVNFEGRRPATPGDLIPAEEKNPSPARWCAIFVPAAPGAKDWQPSAFSPRTGLIYIPHQISAMDYEGVEANYIAGTPYVGANVRMYGGPGGNRGEFSAWDPVPTKRRGASKKISRCGAARSSTAGDVVFYGTHRGLVQSGRCANRQQLWQFKTGSGIIGQPVSYRGPDGKQYIAILSGVGGWARRDRLRGDLDPRDAHRRKRVRANAMRRPPANTRPKEERSMSRASVTVIAARRRQCLHLRLCWRCSAR